MSHSFQNLKEIADLLLILVDNPLFSLRRNDATDREIKQFESILYQLTELLKVNDHIHPIFDEWAGMIIGAYEYLQHRDYANAVESMGMALSAIPEMVEYTGLREFENVQWRG